MNARSSWTWVGPLLVAILILVPTLQFQDGWSWWVVGVAWAFGAVFATWGAINLFLYLGDYIVYTWRDVMEMLYRNGPAGTASAIRDLSPLHLQLLLRISGGAWIMKIAPEEDQGPQYLLAGAEQVPIEFVKFVLDHSSDDALYPQNRFNDQTYSWDGVFRQHTDRDLYKAFQAWLFRNDMVTWPAGNQAARWRNGWTPSKLALRLDLNAFSYGDMRAQPIALEELNEVMRQGSGASVGNRIG